MLRVLKSAFVLTWFVVLPFLVGLAKGGLVVGGFDTTRSQDYSVPAGVDFSGLRNDISSTYASTTFVSFPTLTSSALNGVQVLMIGAVNGSGGTSATSPLSAGEQTALLDYVMSGGGAIIEVDNDNYAGSGTSAVNNSFLAPFGLDVTGSFLNSQTANVTTFTGPITNGPFGSLTSFTTYYPGYFDSLGPNATALASLAANGQPVLAEIAPGALGPHSGAVIFQADTVFVNGFPSAPTGNNLTLALNEINFARQMPGDVNFDGIVNGTDINTVAGHWLDRGNGIPADANGDGIVNGLDINMIASNWLYTGRMATGAGTSVPEPSTLVLAAFGGVALLAYRRRAGHRASGRLFQPASRR
jgi:Dockerin type I domain/PEP-CTERM motif